MVYFENKAFESYYDRLNLCQIKWYATSLLRALAYLQKLNGNTFPFSTFQRD